MVRSGHWVQIDTRRLFLYVVFSPHLFAYKVFNKISILQGYYDRMNNSLEKTSNGYHDYSSSSSGNGNGFFNDSTDSMLMRNKYNNNMDSRNNLSSEKYSLDSRNLSAEKLAATASRNLDYYADFLNNGNKEISGNHGGYEDDFPELSSVSGKFSGLRLETSSSSSANNVPSKNTNNFCF